MERYICGLCGSTKEDEYGYCINGHDYWIEMSDIFNAKGWIRYSIFSKQLIINLLSD